MATAALLRSFRRRDAASAPLSAYRCVSSRLFPAFSKPFMLGFSDFLNRSALSGIVFCLVIGEVEEKGTIFSRFVSYKMIHLIDFVSLIKFV